MNRMARRLFLKGAGVAAAGAMTARWGLPAVRAANAADRLRLGVIGCKRGLLLAREFAKLNVEIAYLCDPEESHLAKARKTVPAEHAVADLRKILDDRSVDAVAIAAPDHWHAPAAIMACQAGKHVYVEKPCSHNVREGRLMIEAARRAKRVMQVGSQTRSTAVFQHAVQLLHEGAIGDVLVAKTWTCQRRPDIGHQQPCDPPRGFDYDLWVGPAPMRPFRPNCYHYTWHWWYDFGTGDAGNRGVHEMDVARWGLGLETHPTLVVGHGSKLFFDDDQQFPDTQYVTFEFPADGRSKRRLIIYEQRIWSPSQQDGYGDGNAFYGTDGYMLLSKHTGWKLFDPKNQLVKEEQGLYSVPEHAADFLEAIRTGKPPSADIEIGHHSATMAHLANILARAGRQRLVFDPKTEHIVGDPEADALTVRTYRQGHWSVPKELAGAAGAG
jgi:predicted dehydrogenase